MRNMLDNLIKEAKKLEGDKTQEEVYKELSNEEALAIELSRIEDSRQHAHRLIDELIDETIQINEHEYKHGTYHGKTFSASMMIKRFNSIEHSLLSWAYAHIYGSLCKYHLQNKPDDFNSDDWEHQFFEAEYIYNHDEPDATEDNASTLTRFIPSRMGYYHNNAYNAPIHIVREYLTEILMMKAGSGLDNGNFYTALSYALHALNVGEVHTLLKPDKKNFKGNKHTLDYLRWLSVIHVWWERGKESKNLNEAREKIGNELSVSIDQLVSWEKSLSKEHDPKKKALKSAKIVSDYLYNHPEFEFNEQSRIYVALTDSDTENSKQYKDYVSLNAPEALIEPSTLSFEGTINSQLNIIHSFPLDKIKKLMRIAHTTPEKVSISWTRGFMPDIKASD